MTTIRTSYTFDPETGSVGISRMSQETMISRMMDAVPTAPHMADLAAATSAGLAWAVLPANAPFPFIKEDERRAFLFIVGDDFLLAEGPDAFHRKTLRKMLGRAVFAGIVPGKPEREFYGRAIKAALDAKGWAVVVETQEGQRAAWLRFLARHAKAAVEISGTAPRAA